MPYKVNKASYLKPGSEAYKRDSNNADNIQLQNFKALKGQIVQLELLAGDLLHEELSDLGIWVLGRGEFSASLAPGEEHLLVRSDGRHIH